MDKNNWIYINDHDNSSRYVLGEKGESPLIIFGINPSVAEPAYLGKSDPTINKIKMLVNKLEGDGWIMLNVYPQRSTNPNEMDLKMNKGIHQKNLLEIENVFIEYPNSKLIAAWGNLITKRSYLVECLRDIYEISLKYNKEWLCFKRNKTGHPKHPLYMKQAKIQLLSYDIKEKYHF